jgi:hypothetical protein
MEERCRQVDAAFERAGGAVEFLRRLQRYG